MSPRFCSPPPPRHAADQITFTETVVGSGTLGGTPFANAVITLTGVGDTADVTSLGGGVFVLPFVTVQVEIAGLGSGTFSDVFHAFANQGNTNAGFSQGTEVGTDLLNVESPAFATYDLTTSISVTGPLEFVDVNTTFSTSAGILDFTGTTGDVTFTAETTAVPEPSALALAVLGAASCFAARRFTRRPSPPVGRGTA